MAQPEKIVGKVIVTGVLRALTPILIGAGEGEYIDIEVVKGYEGNRPYIPGTSLAGVLRALWPKEELLQNQNELLRFFWGGVQDSEAQSHIVVHDLIPNGNAVLTVRDGIRIDPEKGQVAPGAKYDYEVLDAGAEFNLIFEITLRDRFKEGDFALFKKTLNRVTSELANGKVPVGAKTNNGFGRVTLHDAKSAWFSFPAHAADWFRYRAAEKNSSVRTTLLATLPDFLAGVEPFISRDTSFVISGHFKIKSSLIIGASPADPAQPDKLHLTSNNQPILSGTSIKGAIRGRAEKILRTLAGDNPCVNQLMQKNFGYVPTDQQGKKVRGKTQGVEKSRIVVEETPLRNVGAEIQSRIRIDRFTGGVMAGGLFDSMPVWSDNAGGQEDDAIITMSIRNFCEESDAWLAGLLLLVLKDLWTEDLPIGGEKNVGRGILQGISATVGRHGVEVGCLGVAGAVRGRQQLENYVSKLHEKLAELRQSEVAHG